MKQSNTLQTIISNKITKTFVFLTVFFMSNTVYTQAAAQLTKAETALNALKTDLNKLIPIAAAVILLCLAIGYAGRYISKDTFVRWSIGVVIAGSAAELANLLFKGAVS